MWANYNNWIINPLVFSYRFRFPHFLTVKYSRIFPGLSIRFPGCFFNILKVTFKFFCNKIPYCTKMTKISWHFRKIPDIWIKCCFSMIFPRHVATLLQWKNKTVFDRKLIFVKRCSLQPNISVFDGNFLLTKFLLAVWSKHKLCLHQAKAIQGKLLENVQSTNLNARRIRRNRNSSTFQCSKDKNEFIFLQRYTYYYFLCKKVTMILSN